MMIEKKLSALIEKFVSRGTYSAIGSKRLCCFLVFLRAFLSVPSNSQCLSFYKNLTSEMSPPGTKTTKGLKAAFYLLVLLLKRELVALRKKNQALERMLLLSEYLKRKSVHGLSLEILSELGQSIDEELDAIEKRKEFLEGLEGGHDEAGKDFIEIADPGAENGL